MNAETGTWDHAILKNLGISSSLLGDIVIPGTPLGKVNHPGLTLPDTEVLAVCSHDTASAVVSVPFEHDASVFISTGTWCIVGMESERPVLTPEALGAGFTNERGYGGTYRFLKNIVGLWLVQGLAKGLPGEPDYETIESLALGYDGPARIIDPGDPLFYNPEDMKEAFDDFFRKTGQEIPSGPGGYFRAAYDSLIYSFRHHIERIEKLTGKEIGTIHLIGGACKSGYLTRQTALICRRKVVSGPAEAATIGNILVQGMAGRILPDLAAARELVRKTTDIRTFHPGPRDRKRESSYRAFLGLLKG
jgi:rhamnulokinase